MTAEEERVWRYLVNNRQATIEDVVLNCDVSLELAKNCFNRISSPNWREEVSAPNTFMKHDNDKPRMDLIPPEMLVGVAEVLAYGAKKYSANNWANGADWSRYYAALMRHMVAWWSGENTDAETGMSHLYHAGCCLAFLIAYEQRGIGTDDRPNTTASAPATTGRH